MVSTLWYPARAVGAGGRRWWVGVVALWVLTVPVLLVLAQSYLLASLPGQRSAVWGGYLSAAITVVAAALFAAGTPAVVQARLSGARGLHGQVGLLERARRRALVGRVRSGQVAHGGDRAAAELVAADMVVVGSQAGIGAGVGAMALGMAAHTAVVWQVAAVGISGVAAVVASVVRYRNGRRARRWLEAHQQGLLTPTGWAH